MAELILPLPDLPTPFCNPEKSIPEAAIRDLVEKSGAEFIGVQKAVEVFGEDVVLLRHRDIPHSAIGIRVSQLNEFSVLLATASQFCRYRKSVRNPNLKDEMNQLIALCLFAGVVTFCVAIAFPEAVAAVWNAVVPPLSRKIIAVVDLYSYGTVITRPMRITESGRRYVESKEFVLAFGEIYSIFYANGVDRPTKEAVMCNLIAWAAVSGSLKKLPDAMDSADLRKFIVDHWPEMLELMGKFEENINSMTEEDLLDENGLLPDWCSVGATD